ncbi:AHH domain-containing protein [Limobrevibacterium gyesilva]|uniref:AHH domain-containing protein n=1 Tax=Limobrevibacterium gyesilva TaxID=2991712 RepID=A0AA41YLU0_9PROT|nr:AHH domain-containing protein [Limobrevibacterium gyesilva]MCW3474313.1 AHH domain-containing protein [Limobrevibacterium gyesilva]
MTDDPSRRISNPDSLDTPFLFVPHGAPEPIEWMARHPGWVKFPAVMVPRGSRPDSPAAPSPILTTSLGAAAVVAESSGLVEGGATAAVGIAATSIADLAAAAVAAAAAASLVTLGIVFYPRRLQSPDQDENSPELRQLRALPRPEGFVPPSELPAPPGLVPPSGGDLKPAEGGFTPTPPTPPPPGFTPLAPQRSALPGRPAEEQTGTILDRDRNEGLEGGARTRSERARKAARAADPAVVEALREAEWRAHHLINLAGIRRNPGLIQEAVRAGWRTDDERNVVPLPATSEAQQKLREAGEDRPVHDNGHEQWNKDVVNRLDRIESELSSEGLPSGTDAYARRAREKLEQLQNDLRQKMLGLDRLMQNDLPAASMPA